MTPKKFQTTSLGLHIFAMICMLLDHAWATVVPGNLWMNCVGRLAYPVFAFLTVEGYFHTGNLKAYLKRLVILALISEIPFNLMNGGTFADPFHQNVIWTFLIALMCLIRMDRIRSGGKSLQQKALGCTGWMTLGVLAGTIAMVDYHGFGVMTVFVFYFFRGTGWRQKLGQLLGIGLINFVFIQNMDIPFFLFGREFFLPLQGIAAAALLPIWLYHGKQGPHNKWIQYGCYAFYPAHILVLSLIALAG